MLDVIQAFLLDEQVNFKKLIHNDDEYSEESKTAWWLNRLIVSRKLTSAERQYPFIKEELFVLTLTAGIESYHVNVDGRHVTSFPYRIDATGLSINGDLEIQYHVQHLYPLHILALPHIYRSLEMLPQWQAPTLPLGPALLFISILSAGNHFAEPVAVRKSWMEAARKSHGRKEVNVELKKEAEYFGDFVIVHYMDSYDLVILKTVAIRLISTRTCSWCGSSI